MVRGNQERSLRIVPFLKERAVDYFRLTKFRLSLTVVFSALFAFGMAGKGSQNLVQFFILGIGGFLVTASSNIFNQIFEAEFDRLMVRTQNRPLARGSSSQGEALILAISFAFSGVFVLGFFFNLPAALLGIIALLSYGFVYTPLKRVSSIAVLIGAFPGAMPVLIGYAAATGSLPFTAWVLFLIQFIWQFPHFWAIAWLLADDYSKAGFHMLPSEAGRSRFSAYMILLYSLLLLPLGMVPFWVGITHWVSAPFLVLASLILIIPSLTLLSRRSNKEARAILLGSLVYMPLMQLICLLTRI